MPDRRFTAAAAALAGLLVLGSGTAAHAHGDTIHLTVTGVVAGHPTTKATWEDDGHPVSEKVAGTITATSADGTTLGPWRFVPVPGEPGTFTTSEALPAGQWTLTAQTAFPALGRAEERAEVTPASLTGPPAPAGPVAPQRSTAPAPASPAAADPSAHTAAAAGSPRTASEDGPAPGAVALGAVAVVAGAGGIAAFWLLRRRRAHRP
ncbi:hypothetical protein [Streptomyces cinnamoneus]|uniref:DUF4198 domain-containing protein n=1 Tax=Streptomyces cinnamoneus TaxID=53446 RepID=A0A918WFF8_STRCJ|nr:hypothetical protein [Streptomyces cinnamoneus]GHC40731.1 hypothetical protein GCM10010507_13710 [Streptomyces cinnamoneus]